VDSENGNGPKPILQNAMARDNESDWTETSAGSGIWQTDTGCRTDIGNIIFNHGAAPCGIKKFKKEAIRHKMHAFFSERATQKVYLVCDQNPATKYRSIELAINTHGVDHSHCCHVTFDGLYVRYAGAHGFGGINTHNLIIRGCDVGWIGGGLNFPDDGADIRFGNGIEFWEGAKNNLVENNRIFEIYDAGLTNQGHDAGIVQKNIIYRNNLIRHAEMCVEFWNGATATRNVVFENNTCIYGGGGGGRHQRPDRVIGTNMMIYGRMGYVPDLTVRKNVFCYAAGHSIQIQCDWKHGIVLDYNLYCNTGPMLALFGQDMKEIYTATSLETHQTKTGFDVHSIFANPQFVNPAEGDYRLSTDSPASAWGWGKQQWQTAKTQDELPDAYPSVTPESEKSTTGRNPLSCDERLGKSFPPALSVENPSETSLIPSTPVESFAETSLGLSTLVESFAETSLILSTLVGSFAEASLILSTPIESLHPYFYQH
jgi:hypothetical protein